ncbi:MAG: GAF domain-containing sensor histidine kinase [Bacillota bacterium]
MSHRGSEPSPLRMPAGSAPVGTPRSARTHLLTWLTTLGPAAFVGVFEFARHYSPLNTVLPLWAGNVLVFLVVLVGAYFFSGFVFGIISRMQEELIRRTEALAQRTAVAEALYRISTEISAALDLDHVMESVAASTRELVEADMAAVGLAGESSTQLTWRVASASEAVHCRKLLQECGPAILTSLAEYGAPLKLEDVSSRGASSEPPAEESGPHEALRALCRGGFQAVMAVPLRAGEHFAGALIVANCRAARFSDDAAAVVSGLATQAAIAIEKARLVEQVQSLAALEERERIAREMHDGVGQVLGYVSIKAQAVRELVVARRFDEARLQLDQLAAAAREVYTDLRETILGLRTSVRPGRPLVEALREYLEQFSRDTAVAAHLEVPEDTLALRPVVELQLLRIIQEALTNVRKHAQARNVWVRFSQDSGRWQVTVEDDGRGLGASTHGVRGPRFGLQMMRERAQSMGGVFQIASRPGGGTRVLVMLPAESEADGHASGSGG